MTDFGNFHAGVAQFRPKKADYAANLLRVRELFQQIRDQNLHVQVLALPETSMTGYFLQGGVREASVSAEHLLQDLANAYADTKPEHALDVCIGFYEQHENQYYNSALYAQLEPSPEHSRLLHVHRKFFLPTYGVFDEERFVARGKQIDVFQTRFGKAAILICEDVWHSISATIAALKGAQVLYVLVASPARGFQSESIGNVEIYRRILTRVAEEHTLYVVMASLIGFEGGKGFIGGSMVIDPFGATLLQAPINEEALMIAPLVLDNIAIARAQSPLLADLESTLADVARELNSIEA